MFDSPGDRHNSERDRWKNGTGERGTRTGLWSPDGQLGSHYIWVMIPGLDRSIVLSDMDHWNE